MLESVPGLTDRQTDKTVACTRLALRAGARKKLRYLVKYKCPNIMGLDAGKRWKLCSYKIGLSDLAWENVAIGRNDWNSRLSQLFWHLKS